MTREQANKIAEKFGLYIDDARPQIDMTNCNDCKYAIRYKGGYNAWKFANTLAECIEKINDKED